MPMANKLPLSGIRVIDFGRFIAGPYCAMLLADMGADVIRVDRRHGSEDRYIAAITESGEGGGFLSLNRNKRNLTLDTSKPGSAEIIRRLVKGADVVVANLPNNVLKEHAAGLRVAEGHQARHYSGPHFNFRPRRSIREPRWL